MVFWRETGAKDEVEDVDVRDGACSIVATDMIPPVKSRPGQLSGGRTSGDCYF